jgi:spore coat protein U-like protein
MQHDFSGDFRPPCHLTRRLLCLLPFVWALMLLAAPSPAAAQSCTLGSAGGIVFGLTSPDRHTDTQASLPYTCQSNASPTYFRLCMYLPEGPIAGVRPRRMTNGSGAQMEYDLYSDAARTQVIGPPPPAGNSFQVYSFTALVPGGGVQQQGAAPIYGRVPAGQNLPAGNAYQVQIGGGTMYWAWSNASYPTDCTGGAGGAGSATFSQSVSASVSNACRITLATDLNFGNTDSLKASLYQTSAIMVRCPVGTEWRLGLSNGNHPEGTTRRMLSSASGQYVTYELYRDSVHTERWGNTVGTDTASGAGEGESTPITRTIYGRVPAQPTAAPGLYSDTVTVTLTY